MSDAYRRLCMQVCNLAHTCVMTEHPDRAMCDSTNCDTVRMVDYMVAKLEAPVGMIRKAGFDAHMKTLWSDEKIAAALQAIIPLVMERTR